MDSSEHGGVAERCSDSSASAPAQAPSTTTNGSVGTGAGTGAGAGGAPAVSGTGSMPLPAGRAMSDAERVLRGIMTYRPPVTVAECRTRKETRRVISRYTTALGLSSALGIKTRPPADAGDVGADADAAVQQTPLRVVHVAGTKGKGSTCAFVESILRAHGLRTGFFSSPHLVSVRERIRLDGKPIPEPLFLKYFWHVVETLNKLPTFRDEVGFFRFMTLLGLYTFAAERVDAVVLEVGIGGRLDATNVVRAPYVCGITLLDYDHMNVLGATLAEIGREKAGILKTGVPAFTVLQQTPEASKSLSDQAAVVGSTLRVVTPDELELFAASSAGGVAAAHDELVALGLDGVHQRTNAALAVALARQFLTTYASHTAGFAGMDVGTTLGALASVQWPGRAQLVRIAAADGHPRVTLALDGAHTVASVQCAAQWFSGVVAEARRELQARAGAGAPRGRVRAMLLFNCGYEKRPEHLLYAIHRAAGGVTGTDADADAGIQFERAVFAPFDFAKPSKAPPPTNEELLARLRALQASGETGDEGSAVAAADASAAGTGTAAASTAKEPKAVRWLRSIRAVWQVLNSEGADSGVATDSTVVASSMRAAVELVAPQARRVTRARAQSWHSNVDEGSTPATSGRGEGEGGSVDAGAIGTDDHVVVLGTGSLYLVGNVLEALGWDADACRFHGEGVA